MRFRRGLLAFLPAALAAACTSLVAFPDVPQQVDAGASDAKQGLDSGPSDATKPRLDAPVTHAEGGVDAGMGACMTSVDASAEPPASCAGGGPGLTNCGEDAGESCCASLLVDGGTFYRVYDIGDPGTSAYDAALSPDGGPTYPYDSAVDFGAVATVSSFRLDKYEVTVGRYLKFIGAVQAGYAPPEGSGKHSHLNCGMGLQDSLNGVIHEPGWQASDDTFVNRASFSSTDAGTAPSCLVGDVANGDSLEHPARCVDWYQAYAFCIWDGGFLPSEAEWAYATAGGAEQRPYPWGSAPPGDGSEYAVFDCHTEPGTFPFCYTNAQAAANVGSAPSGAGRWGQLDLVGNVTEWTLDSWEQDFQVPCLDCAVFYASQPGRSYHGADFAQSAPFLLPNTRGEYPPSFSAPYLGFRCARRP